MTRRETTAEVFRALVPFSGGFSFGFSFGKLSKMMDPNSALLAALVIGILIGGTFYAVSLLLRGHR